MSPSTYFWGVIPQNCSARPLQNLFKEHLIVIHITTAKYCDNGFQLVNYDGGHIEYISLQTVLHINLHNFYTNFAIF